jgi:hypothetical protein
MIHRNTRRMHNACKMHTFIVLQICTTAFIVLQICTTASLNLPYANHMQNAYGERNHGIRKRGGESEAVRGGSKLVCFGLNWSD